MQRRRSAAGASLLALLALVVVPVVVFFTIDDLAIALVAGPGGGAVLGYMILVVAMNTHECHGYLEGVGRVFSGGEEQSGAGGYAGWGMTVVSALAAVGIAVRVWRSEDPLVSVLRLVGFLVGAVVASFVLVVVVMAFGDLVDWVLRKGRQ